MTSLVRMLLKSLTQEDMVKVGHVLASLLEGETVVSLEGELGSGKTFVVRQIANALGVPHSVTSPTFVLQKIYVVPNHPRIRRLVHYDVYRLASYDELVDLGFEELSCEEAAFVEWGDRFMDFMPNGAWRIRLSILDEERRQVELLLPSVVATNAADALKAVGLDPQIADGEVDAP